MRPSSYQIPRGPSGAGSSNNKGSDFSKAEIPLKATVTIGRPPNPVAGLNHPRSAKAQPPLEDGNPIMGYKPKKTHTPISLNEQVLEGGIKRRGVREVMSNGNFSRPPLDPAGVLCDASDRPILCMSCRGNEVILGSADHALYGFEVSSGKKLRRLYTKTRGHIDWVSTCSHLTDGRIISGGGDGKVCVWQARGAVCVDLDGHASAVSKVEGIPNSKLALSSGYDNMIKIWNTDRSSMAACMSGLDPIMDFVWENNTLFAGDRRGVCEVFDLKTTDLLRCLRGHRSHITTVQSLTLAEGQGDDLFLSGGQDGMVRVWDLRSEECLYALPCHTSKGVGTGALAGIKTTAAGLVVTGAADRRICVLEPRMSFQTVNVFEDHRDFIYSMHVDGDILFSGGGDGMLLAHDVVKGSLLYGLGANQGAVRCITTNENSLIAAGDDGKCLIFSYT